MNYEKYFKNKDTMSSQYIDLLKSSGLFYEKSDDVWLYSIKDILPLSKGFKIHISALITNATKILEMFLYFIEKHDILLNFKVVKSLNELENQNSGGNGFFSNRKIYNYLSI